MFKRSRPIVQGLIILMGLLSSCGGQLRLASGLSEQGHARIDWQRPGPVSEHAPVADAPTESKGKDEDEPMQHAKPISTSAARTPEDTEPRIIEHSADDPTAGSSSTRVPIREAEQEMDVPAWEEAEVHDLEAGGSEDFNVLACVSFAASLLGLVLLSTSYGGWLVLAAIVMAIIALIQISQRGERGKGFAIIAIALPVTLFFFVLLLLSRWGFH